MADAEILNSGQSWVRRSVVMAELPEGIHGLQSQVGAGAMGVGDKPLVRGSIREASRWAA